MMQCDQDGDRALRYVSGEMAEPEQSAFEDHFFDCAACFREVQTLQDAHATLRGTGRPSRTTPERFRFPIRWMAAAATIILAVVIWRLPRTPESAAPPVSTVAAPSTPVPAATAPPSPQPSSSVAQQPASTPAAAPAESLDDRLVRMATVVPPRYVSLTTRSEADENAAAFALAMTDYAIGRYARTSEELAAIAARAPDLVHVQFFLGISRLLAGDTTKAKAALNATVAAGAPPYSDEAHFYLAKAALKEKDLGTARRELRSAIAREAGPKGEARRLLAEIDETVSR
jgi:hypothetical protein